VILKNSLIFRDFCVFIHHTFITTTTPGASIPIPSGGSLRPVKIEGKNFLMKVISQEIH